MEMLEVARRSHIPEPLAQMSGGEQFWGRAVRRSATAEENYLSRGLMEGRGCKSSSDRQQLVITVVGSGLAAL
jgi:hypothetical protein